jgi:SAM-dependent methyltransferase
MKYEPIKHSIDRFISKKPFLKRLFFRLLDLYLLRTWHVHKALRQARNEFKGGFKVLDGGAGFGQYSFWILKKFKKAEVTGIDISQSHVDKAQAFFDQSGFKGRAFFKQGDLTQFVQEDSFDMVVSVDVMEHILDDRKVFENFHKSLKTGGVLFVSTPSDQGGSDVHDHDHDHENDGSESFIDEHVRDGYGVEEIREKLSTAGFSKVETRYTYGRPGKISWKLLMKIPITLLNVSKVFFILLPFYWIIVYPFCLILNYADTHMTHKTGTGLMVKAWK